MKKIIFLFLFVATAAGAADYRFACNGIGGTIPAVVTTDEPASGVWLSIYGGKFYFYQSRLGEQWYEHELTDGRKVDIYMCAKYWVDGSQCMIVQYRYDVPKDLFKAIEAGKANRITFCELAK